MDFKTEHKELSIRPLLDRQVVPQPSHSAIAHRLASAEGDTIYALTKDRTISRLDVETGKTICQWKRAHE